MEFNFQSWTRSNSNSSSPTTARLIKAGSGRKSALGVQENASRRRWRNYFRARRACTVPAARIPAFMRSAWSRILKCRAADSRCRPRGCARHQLAFLPDDIRVLSAVRKPAKFHARFDATGKQYRYFVWNAVGMNPLLRHTRVAFSAQTGFGRDARGGKIIFGQTRFQSFADNRAVINGRSNGAETDARRPQKNRRATDVHHRGRRLSVQNVSRHRRNAGAGRYGKNFPAKLPRMLASRDRRVAGMTAPAHGLVLWKVYYDRSQKSEARIKNRSLADDAD
jgi:tRNA U38,U39,U40 pseudouridine synthase TruA